MDKGEDYTRDSALGLPSIPGYSLYRSAFHGVFQILVLQLRSPEAQTFFTIRISDLPLDTSLDNFGSLCPFLTVQAMSVISTPITELCERDRVARVECWAD